MTFDQLIEGRYYITRIGQLVGPIYSLHDSLTSDLFRHESWDVFGNDKKGILANDLIEIVPEFAGWEPTMEYRIPGKDDEGYVDAGSCNFAPKGQGGTARCYGQGQRGFLLINPNLPGCSGDWAFSRINMHVFDGKRVIMRRSTSDHVIESQFDIL